MKKRLTIISFLLVLLGITGAKANESNSTNVSNSIKVCESPDDAPCVSGNLDMLFERNFKYPAEAWKVDHKEYVNVDVTVDSKGVVRDAVCTGDVHPALQDEVKRVMMKTTWYPAVKDGHDVGAMCKVFLNLKDNRLRATSPFPYGLKDEVKGARKIAESWSKITALSDIRDEDRSAVARMTELFPDYLPMTYRYVGLLNAEGDSGRACELMDSSLKYMHDRYISLDSMAQMLITQKEDVVRMRPGYSGRSEIAVALLRAMVRKMDGAPNTEEAFDNVINLIDNRIVDGDVFESLSENERRSVEWQERVRYRDLVNQFKEVNPHKVAATDAFDKMFGNYSIDQLRMAYYYWSKHSPERSELMRQLSDRLEKERENALKGKYLKSNTLELFGVKALTLWLCKGDEALDSYVAEIVEGEGSDKVKRYLTKLQKSFRQHDNSLADKDRVVKSIISLLPDNSKEPSVAELKNCRKAMGEVFPLKWLYATRD